MGTPSISTTLEMVQETDSSDDDNLTFEKVYKPTTSASNSSQMRLKLTNTAIVAQRYNISHRGAAAFGSALLEDMGFISETDRTHIIDKNKISREKTRTEKELKVAAQKDNNGHLTGLYFDGRRDSTLFREKHGAKYFQKTIKEDHYSLVKEPGSKYLGHAKVRLYC